MLTESTVLGFILLIFIYEFYKYEYNTVENDFKIYLKRFNKTYTNNEEFKRRLEIFKESQIFITEMNSKRHHHSSAQYGFTKFSDMTSIEFSKHFLQSRNYQNPEKKNRKFIRKDRNYNRKKRFYANLPKKIDWRQKHIVGEVINQKNCGACWALSLVETLESIYALKYGKYTQLSIQQLLDCMEYGNGCEGGDMCNSAFWMIEKNIKLRTESEYPLKLVTNECKLKNDSGVQLFDYECEDLSNYEFLILNSLAKHGPVSAAVNAVSWQNYLGGIIQFHCSGSHGLLNHAVQIVGYDLDAQIPHYIVRNSWGADFGDKGYLYIGIGQNLCGIANEVLALDVI